MEEPSVSGTGSRKRRIPNDSMKFHNRRSSCRRDTKKRTSQTQRATPNSKAAAFDFTFQKVMSLCKDACSKSKFATNFCDCHVVTIGRTPAVRAFGREEHGALSRTTDHPEDIHKSNCHVRRPQEMSNHRSLNEHSTTFLRVGVCRWQQILFLGECAPKNSCPHKRKVLNLKSNT